jgi:LCP family protein required for cell wall assembly
MTEIPKKSTSKKRLLTISSVLLVALLLAIAIWFPSLKKQWEAPLGPSLNLPTYTATNLFSTSENLLPTGATSTRAVVSQAAEKPVESETEAPTAIAVIPPTATKEPLCGGPATMTVLAVGVDTDDDTYTYGLGDAIRIARVDFTTPKVTVLSIPRDIWVEIPDISDHYGITHGKLNQSYFYGSPGMAYYDGPGGGPGLMARTLDLNFGLRVDHYGAVNMITFSRIVDAVGGIDVYLPYDVDGTPTNSRTDDMGYFTAGNHHFNGDEAMRFSRIRKRYNDFTRMDHQNIVICALKEKLLTPTVLPKIPQIIGAFKDAVITDLSLEQMGQLACLLPHLDSSNLIFTGLPEDLFAPGRVFSPQMRDETFVMEIDMQEVRRYMEIFTNGTWPTTADTGGSTCP